MSTAKHVKYSFKAKVWKYKGKAAWYFVSLPKNLSKKIRNQYGKSEEGWGRLKTAVKIGATQVETSIWFDTKQDTYILPIKSQIRKSEGISKDDSVSVTLQFASEKRKILTLGF